MIVSRATQRSRQARGLPYATLIALIACCLLSGLTACTPIDRVFRNDETSANATPVATQRPRATPVAAIPGPPAPTPIAPITTLVPEHTIAFVSDRDGQIDLYLLDIITRQVWRLTDDTAIESFPTWSPEGTTIAYVVEDERAIRNLWLLDLGSGLHRQLTQEGPPFDVRRPAWLDGGQVLIYDTGKPFDRRPELRAITVGGQQLSPLLPVSGSVILDWDTDGETIICAVVPNLGQPRLVVADAVPGAELRPEANAPIGFDVRLSPNGRYATFSAPPLSEDQITYVLDIMTGAIYPINDRVQRPNGLVEPVRGRRYEHDFSWLPDSRGLVFVHGTGGVTDGQGKLKLGNLPPPLTDGYVGLWLTNRTDQVGERRRAQITTGTADAAPRPSSDGRWIAFLTDAQQPNAAESNIWIIAVDAVDGHAPEQHNLTPETGNNWAPAWMPLPLPR